MVRKLQAIKYVFLLFAVSSCLAQNTTNYLPGTWGDQGNGTYINPILNADYSDPDAIRVGDDYYMVCSEFHFMGIPVLHSKDLVNWTIIARVYDELKFAPGYDTNDCYAGGSWAPSIRYHDNKYWIYFCTPGEGLFMTTAERPEGPWEPLTQVVSIAHWEDPCPFWDEDGQGYLGRSQYGAGPIYLHKLSADGKQLLDNGLIVYTGPVAEGTKIHKRNGYYYISIPEGGVPTGWQTILRSKNIYGPYEKKVVLEKGVTDVNGPHQGAWIDTPDGQWWFIHFQSVDNIGRVCHLQPMSWKNDWPIIGVDIDMNGIGEPVFVWKKPNVGKTYPIQAPQTSDNFDSDQLGFQWSWNHNPQHSAWTLKKNPGYLSLTALPSTSFLKAKNTLTQKVMGKRGKATTFLLTNEMKEGQKAGLCVMGKEYNLIGIVKENGKLSLFSDINGEVSTLAGNFAKIYLQVTLTSEGGNNQFYYSTDNKTYKPFGGKFAASNGHWKGPKIGLFSYNEKEDGGIAKFDWYQYEHDGPQEIILPIKLK
ncbi:Non-reducing end alpha-L-arabinofuranosidase BoGH43B [termite gut metagenome]|uniref:Non-reducing end alpha-L-arabinofuranosidase BoGH43B n=1 Tax=termite gut metagenome TaxID=433724 RepID=A0A5J4RR87_9ZZZZ